MEKFKHIYIVVPKLVNSGPVKGAIALYNLLKENHQFVFLITLKIVVQSLDEKVIQQVITFGQTEIKYLLNNLIYQMNLKKILKIFHMVQ